MNQNYDAESYNTYVHDDESLFSDKRPEILWKFDKSPPFVRARMGADIFSNHVIHAIAPGTASTVY